MNGSSGLPFASLPGLGSAPLGGSRIFTKMLVMLNRNIVTHAELCAYIMGVQPTKVGVEWEYIKIKYMHWLLLQCIHISSYIQRSSSTMRINGSSGVFQDKPKPKVQEATWGCTWSCYWVIILYNDINISLISTYKWNRTPKYRLWTCITWMLFASYQLQASFQSFSLGKGSLLKQSSRTSTAETKQFIHRYLFIQTPRLTTRHPGLWKHSFELSSGNSTWQSTKTNCYKRNGGFLK